jgi:NAD-dependent SIR2 family protein deacetylase
LKPTTVLFGAQLPTEFFERKKEDLPGTDLVIVAGTSLVVSPANTVAQDASGMRFVVNREPVGRELGIVYEEGPAAATSRDIFAAGECDAVFLRLAEVLGWRSDLEALAEEQGRLPDASRALILGGGSVDGRLGAL